jgi:DNA-binding NarL/FixJ family response regulator
MTKEGELGEVSRQVLQLLAQGLSVPEMAKALWLHENSVKYHLSQLAQYFCIKPKRSGAHLRGIVWAGIVAGKVELPAR